jgi:hypothetical protein
MALNPKNLVTHAVIGAALLAFPLSCHNEQEARTLPELTSEEQAAAECLASRVIPILTEKRRLLGQQIELLSQGKPTTHLTIALRRLEEDFCAAQTQCLGANAFESSLYIDSCLESEARDQ